MLAHGSPQWQPGQLPSTSGRCQEGLRAHQKCWGLDAECWWLQPILTIPLCIYVECLLLAGLF